MKLTIDDAALFGLLALTPIKLIKTKHVQNLIDDLSTKAAKEFIRQFLSKVLNDNVEDRIKLFKESAGSKGVYALG